MQPTIEDIGDDTDTDDAHVSKCNINNVFFSIKSSPKWQLVEPKNTKSDDGHVFRPNAQILENGVTDFTNNLVINGDTCDRDFSEFISGQVPSEFQFEDDMSGEEDAALGNAATRKSTSNCR